MSKMEERINAFIEQLASESVEPLTENIYLDKQNRKICDFI